MLCPLNPQTGETEMSTRSLTVVRSRWEESEEFEINAVVYRHHDGYLKSPGHGQWLFDFLDSLCIVNGIGGKMPAKYANGPGRLAAQLVAKRQADGHDPDLSSVVTSMGQEFQYQIDLTYDTKGIEVTVFDGPMTAFGMGGEDCTNQIFKGTVGEYGKFLDDLAE